MNQKQAKRLRRMEQDITILYDAQYSAATRFARLEQQLYIPSEVKPSLWHRLQLWLQR